MKRIIIAAATILTISLATVILPTALVSAASCNGVQTSLDYGCSAANTDNISVILLYIINFMAVGVGIAVVAGIAWGGLTYARAGGDSGATKEGIEIIRNSIIGLLLFLGLYALMNFFIPGGAFNLNSKTATIVPTATYPTPGSGSGSPAQSSASIKGVYNFRDASSSGVIKSGVLYRSGLLANIDTQEGKPALQKLLDGGTIIDLRSKSNIATDGADPAFKNVDHKNYYIDGTTKYADFVNNPKSRAGFSSAIKYIANNDGPFLIHCTYGKDRTGWTVAMIMYALGASDSQVMTEFMASNGNLPAGKSVKEKYLTDGLSAIKPAYGTVDNYLKKGLGLTSSDIANLKKKLAA